MLNPFLFLFLFENQVSSNKTQTYPLTNYWTRPHLDLRMLFLRMRRNRRWGFVKTKPFCIVFFSGRDGKTMHSFVWILVIVFCFFYQMLSRLLNSTHPEDLKAANKLIKEMVQEVRSISFSFPFLKFQQITEKRRSPVCGWKIQSLYCATLKKSAGTYTEWKSGLLALRCFFVSVAMIQPVLLRIRLFCFLWS